MRKRDLADLAATLGDDIRTTRNGTDVLDPFAQRIRLIERDLKRLDRSQQMLSTGIWVTAIVQSILAALWLSVIFRR